MSETRRPRPDWGDPDPQHVLSEREPEQSRRQRLVGGARTLAVLGLVGVVLAGLGGYLLARSSPQVAARVTVSSFVDTEPFGTSTQGPAPTSGSNEFGVTDVCGPSASVLGLDDQRRAIYSGVVIVQTRDRELLPDLEDWAAGVDAPIITAPNPELDTEVVATAWTRRMSLTGVNRELLSSFVIAHGRMGPALASC